VPFGQALDLEILERSTGQDDDERPVPTGDGVAHAILHPLGIGDRRARIEQLTSGSHVAAVGASPGEGDGRTETRLGPVRGRVLGPAAPVGRLEAGVAVEPLQAGLYAALLTIP